MATNQPVWAIDGRVGTTTQGLLGVNTIKLGLPVVAKNDTRRQIGKIIVNQPKIECNIY